MTSSTLSGDTANDAVGIDVSDVCGASEDDIKKIAAHARTPLGYCLPKGGGAIEVDVRGTARNPEVTLTPGSSLDATARARATEALHETFHEQTASSTGPTISLSGFSSLLTISW